MCFSLYSFLFQFLLITCLLGFHKSEANCKISSKKNSPLEEKDPRSRTEALGLFPALPSQVTLKKDGAEVVEIPLLSPNMVNKVLNFSMNDQSVVERLNGKVLSSLRSRAEVMKDFNTLLNKNKSHVFEYKDFILFVEFSVQSFLDSLMKKGHFKRKLKFKDVQILTKTNTEGWHTDPREMENTTIGFFSITDSPKSKEDYANTQLVLNSDIYSVPFSNRVMIPLKNLITTSSPTISNGQLSHLAVPNGKIFELQSNQGIVILSDTQYRSEFWGKRIKALERAHRTRSIDLSGLQAEDIVNFGNGTIHRSSKAMGENPVRRLLLRLEFEELD